VKDMTTKRVVVLGLALLVVIVAMGLASPSLETAAPRQLSDRAMSIIGAVDPAARVRPQDVQCNVKVGWGLAQCGSQASSCKNCHEVKGEDSVNAKGDWHVAHAFGDFCEFCHGGNVQATDEAAAHQGLVQPLDDVKTNCSSCHAADYQTKAETYAKALGVTVGASTGGTTPPSAPAATTSNTAAQPAQSTQSAQPQTQQPAPAATPTYSEVTDYVAAYRAAKPLPPSAGTLVTGMMLALTVVGGGSFIFWNEKRLRSMPRPAASDTPADEQSQEIAQLQPILKKLDVESLRALRTLLSKRS
jgi:hypothetical protein